MKCHRWAGGWDEPRRCCAGGVARFGLHGSRNRCGDEILGTLLGRRLGVARDVSLLVTVGTAICGGSAIAAVAPAIRAKDHDVSMALATVFVLNAVAALLIFPPIGRALHLGQDSFAAVVRAGYSRHQLGRGRGDAVRGTRFGGCDRHQAHPGALDRARHLRGRDVPCPPEPCRRAGD